ncbi:ImmA/IrrE family metallo-endopeptidase [Streptomyces sp. ISL-10]|uniref:ImmA/IrrE family metallo-endopeptidase n=1 Tax=Streptomyces sp. ISL-10 TaxID=2819172 RepID=UPI001BE694F4|nr:ImmA/IrrE family metallo-endopeptidase [Streptomyces sp. ISL-10]MBT2367156.1 ImmA/IrrE family metallo-endopeptidase [Streptomyces sp. ISL-10]
MADTIAVYGHRVRQARTIRHSPIKPLAGLLDISPSAWTALERSTTTDMPRMRLRMLATRLQFPMEFFLQPPGLPIHRGSLLFRAKKSIKAAQVDALTTFSEMSAELLASLGEHATQPPLRLPTSLRPGITPEEAARQTRHALDVAEDEPIGHVTHALERAGVPIVVADVDMPDAKHDAFSVWAGDFHEQPLVVARPVNSWERTRWSIAHEAGHLALHRGTAGEVDEEEANRFANEFLLPAAMLREEWPTAVTLTSLMPLKQRWQMSLASLIVHGKNQGLIEADRAAGLFKQLSARRDPTTGVTWRVQEPGWADQEPERPRLLTVMAERGLGRRATPELFSSLTGGWAVDLMEQVVSGQREAPAVVQEQARTAVSALPGNVVELRRA